MGRYLLVLVSFFASVGATAQTVIAAQGATYANATASIDITIGEVVIATGTDGVNNITQGFHQTSWSLVGWEDLAPDFEAIIFPNPTEDVLHIKVSTFQHVTLSVYDVCGKLIMQHDLTSQLTSIPTDQLSSGSYLLTLSNKAHCLERFKVIKN